jgi:hypothetical protein
MLNLPIQNLLSNQSKKINLITEEYDKINISEDQNRSFENIFLITSIIFTTLLSALTYYNYQKNTELTGKYSQLVTKISGFENSSISNTELENRISELENYKSLNNSKLKISEFFIFLSKIIEFSKGDQIVDINYTLSNKKIDYVLIINSSKLNLNQDINTFFQENLTPNKVEKVREVNIPNSTLKQYEFKGTYETR